jgi:4-amino-4-deoxychorismate lyase
MTPLPELGIRRRLSCGVPDQRVVALLGVGVVPADAPILRADDLGVLRGDGIFETLNVRDGSAWLLDEHLDRMAGSAGRMQLDLPPRESLADLVAQALAAWPAGVEGALRLVCTRGGEHSGGTLTVFATVSGVPPEMVRARRDGIGVRTATLGFPAGLRKDAPWLLAGAKTLSYAVNMASQRWAQATGADDVLWVSTDGYALEAPTSSLVWLDGTRLCTVPVAETGILAGTTARWLLDHAGQLGWTTGERMITPAELAGADSTWLTSSVRGIAAIRTLDGAPMPFSSGTTGRIRELLGFA